MSDFILSEQTNDDAWDALIATSPQSSPFSRSAFLAALAVKVRRYVLSDARDVPLLAWPMLYGADDVPLPAPYPLTMYQGPMLCHGLSALPPHRRAPLQLEALDGFLALLGRRQERIVASCHHSFDDLRAVLWFNYHTPDQGVPAIKLRYTGLLDLDQAETFETITARFRKSRHEDYRKSTKAGLVLSESTDVALLDHLHAATFARQGLERDAITASLLPRLATACLTNGLAEMLLASRPDGTPVAATLFTHDQHAAYYLIGASDPDHRNLGANTWLLFEHIRRAHQAGLKHVDFVGINSPNRGDFKTSFNARPVPYFDIDWRSVAKTNPAT